MAGAIVRRVDGDEMDIGLGMVASIPPHVLVTWGEYAPEGEADGEVRVMAAIADDGEDETAQVAHLIAAVIAHPKLADVAAERDRQDAKWGAPTDRPDGTGAPNRVAAAEQAKAETDSAADAGVLTWRHILAEEVAEAFAESDPVKLREELVQVAAVAVKWLQVLDERAETAAA